MSTQETDTNAILCCRRSRQREAGWLSGVLRLLPVWLCSVLVVGMNPALVSANAQIPMEYRSAHVAGSVQWQIPPVFEPVTGSRRLDRLLDLRPGRGHATAMDRIHVSIPDHAAINRYVSFYQNKGRRTFADAIRRSWSCVPQMMSILDRYGVPRELVYMVLVESRFQKRARSHRGAAGFWQFMPATARAMGLKVGPSVDERLDIMKSTRAAAKYLSKLYRRFGSWPLALAAYNAGGGAVSKALGRVRTDTFWEIYRRRLLSKQTRQYVPKVLAAIHVIRNLEQFGFQKPPREPARYAVYRTVEKALTLARTSE